MEVIPLNIAEYGFRVEGRAPKVEERTMKSAMERILIEVFAGWPEKWQFGEADSGTRFYFHSSMTLREHYVLSIVVQVTNQYIVPEIQYESEYVDSVLCSEGFRHHLYEGEALPDAVIQHKTEDLIRDVLKKAVARCKTAVKHDHECPTAAMLFMPTIERWKS